MAQHDYVIANGTGAAVRSDLNNALAAIVSQNSGATEPATTYAFQFWADTTTSTLKLRNSSNNAWIELMQLDGTLTMEDGTEALPGLSFRNDLDTGLWRPGANQLAISTNAVERVEFGASEVVFNDGGANYDFRVEGDTNANLLFVDASADAVGIGTSSPGSLLEIKSAASTDCKQTVSVTTATQSAFTAFVNTTVSTVGTENSAGGNLVSGSSPYATILSNNSAYPIQFGTNNTVRATLDSSGRLGIGTTSPGQLLEINGASNPCVLIKDTTNNVIAYAFADDNVANFGSASAHPVVFRINNNEAARIDASSRLLLGTSTSRSNVYNSTDYDARFQIEGTDGGTSAIGVFRNSNDNGGSRTIYAKSRGTSIGSNTVVQSGDQLGSVSFQGSDGTEFVEGACIECFVDATPGANDMPGRLVFSTTRDGQSSPTEAARILNNQTILVGKTTDDATSTGITLGGANAGSAGQVLAVSSADAGIFYRKTTSAGDGVILTKSNIGGTNTLVGAGFANGTFGTVSDATKKKNIETARNYLDDIKNIRVVKYNWNTDEDGTPKELGWIAQEVEQVFPGMVTEMEGAKLLKKEVFVPMLMKCIQEQQAIIENLEARLTALESA